ncbi:MAG: SPFH/Band 7/PHB domain protein, partial [Deltaproteobacteria bacterium]|nr:SPFH/Band 7/PHB domain protein [Deltaproteobacteria bacterium]
MTFDLEMFLLGAAIVVGATLFGVIGFTRLLVFNAESHEVLQLRFGKLRTRITDAGYTGSTRIAPYDRWIAASRQWDQRIYRAIESNDSQGTMVQVELRVTFRIADVERALFSVTNWEEALESTTLHEAAALLAGKDRTLFLRSSPQLTEDLTASLVKSLTPYGIEVREARILNVAFRPEVARQMFEAVAAKLEVAKAEYEEKGRTDAALLLARTEQQVAGLESRAKTEGLKAVGRAYEELRRRPEIFEAYTHLYRLSQLDPSRIVSFDGFEPGQITT